MSNLPSSTVPPRASMRLSKPSARKRAQSISVPAPRQKKQKAVIKPRPPLTETFSEEELDRQDEIEDIEGEVEIEEAEEEEAEEEDAEEVGEPEGLKFMSIWRATCGKEQLPGTQSRVLDPCMVSMLGVYEWQDTLFAQLHPKTFKVIGLQAVASYDRCRTADEMSQELKMDNDLASIINVLVEWHRRAPKRTYKLRIELSVDEILPLEILPSTLRESQQGQQTRRLTSTRRQEAALSNVLESEERAGNYMGQISDQWPCDNSHCRNKGKTCWRPGKLNGPDIAGNHFPVPGYLFQRWSQMIRDGEATVDEPSNTIVLALAREKSHAAKKQQKDIAKTEDPTTVTASLINVLLAAQIRHLEPPPSYTHPSASRPIQDITPMNQLFSPSSPIQTSVDPQIILEEFFDWLLQQQGNDSQRKQDILQRVKLQLVEDEWEVDTLRERRDGKGMTEAIWVENYGFKIGTLVMIRSRISEFKIARPRSQGSSGSNSSARS